MLLAFQDLVERTRPQVRTATARDAAALIGVERELLIVDVRETSEYNEGSLDGAVNIPRGVLEIHIGTKAKDAGRPILLYCALGGRAILAAKVLAEMGYRNVTAVDSAFADLQAAAGQD